MQKEILLSDLKWTISQLGNEGGVISPSIYDTAQMLRFFPPKNTEPGLKWLIDQQQKDGGWGDPEFPLYRDVPTLASLLVLQKYKDQIPKERAEAGFKFLQTTAEKWQEAKPTEWPIASELIFSKLLSEVNQSGQSIDVRPYQCLIDTGAKRLSMLRKIKLQASTTPAHCWESWAEDFDPSMQDGSGGIGNSIAATSKWLCEGSKLPSLNEQFLKKGEKFLNNASKATTLNIPGVVPFAYPIDRFEQAFGLYALTFNKQVLKHPNIQPVFAKKAKELAHAMTPTGISYNDFFATDVDDTAAAVAVLSETEYAYDLHWINQYKHSEHSYYVTYPNEMHVSLSANIHAIHALQCCDKCPSDTLEYIISLQEKDGKWVGDKWHASWFYSTTHMMHVLMHTNFKQPLEKALQAILSAQAHDGGFRRTPQVAASIDETAYAVSILSELNKKQLLNTNGQLALKRGYQFLLERYTPFYNSPKRIWVGKELYAPYRVNRMFLLTAMLSVALSSDVT